MCINKNPKPAESTLINSFLGNGCIICNSCLLLPSLNKAGNGCIKDLSFSLETKYVPLTTGLDTLSAESQINFKESGVTTMSESTQRSQSVLVTSAQLSNKT